MTDVVKSLPYPYMAEKGQAVRNCGYQLIPIEPGTKACYETNWATINALAADITKWSRIKRYGIGIFTTKTPVLDVDCFDSGFVKEYIREIDLRFNWPPVRVGNRPKCAILFRTDAPFSKMISAEYIDSKGRKAQLEILGEGQQFVAFAIHPDTHEEYKWIEDRGDPTTVRAEDLPLLTAERRRWAVELFESMCEARGWQRKSSAPVDDGELRGDPAPPDWERSKDRIKSALPAIPDEARADHDAVWLPVLMALHYESEGSPEGLEIADEWSSTASNYNKTKTVEQVWNSIRREDGRIRTAGTIYHIAKRYGWTGESAGELIQATPFQWTEPALIPRRQWVYGNHLIRGFVSSTVATGGRGKTSLLVTEGLAMVTGRALLGDKPAGQLRVWIISTEDPKDELQRRVAAACIHYGITESDIGGRLFLDAGYKASTVVATETREGIKIAVPVVDALIAEIRRKRIDVLSIDPFVDSHEVSENDNTRIAAVIRIWARIADETGCAIELSHHSRKPGGTDQTLTVEDARGATSIIYKVRDARIMNTMSAKQAEMAGIANPRFYFNIISGKGNLAPPPDKADWRRFIGVPLFNGSEDLDPGDEIGVVESWEWPDFATEVSDDNKREIQLRISKGAFGAAPQAGDWVGKMVAEVLGLDIESPVDRALVRELLGDLRKTRAIKYVSRVDKHRHEREFVEIDQWVNNSDDSASVDL